MTTTTAALCPLTHRGHTPRSADPVLCHGHNIGVHNRLVDITWLWGILDDVAVPGPSSDSNVRGKAVAPAAPMNLDVLVARDHRGDGAIAPVLGTWARYVTSGRRIMPPPSTVASYLAVLTMSAEWILARDVAPAFFTDLLTVHRRLRHAAGDVAHNPRVGSCPAPAPDGSEDDCNGALVKDTIGYGVHCVECGDQWSEAMLRRLGILLATPGVSE